MGLSYDLISEFVKITNDKKENTKEGTVYATVVSGTGGKYVQIDGSDLLTPMDTTTDIEDGERVTLMIKDHKAIVTGNVTTPSASTSKVDKVTESVNSVSDRVGTFELVVADKVSTNELEAYKATIEVLVAGKATIEDLTATNAKIENLEVENAEIENLVAEKATITDLEAVNATIENLKVKDAEIENAVVENLKATTADIKVLNADFAQIKTLVNGNLTSDNILSFNLTSGKVTVDDAFIKDAMIDTISAGKINAGKINTNSVSIGSEDGGMLITGSTQQFTDKNGNVRIQIGKDTSGDFTFILYGEDGKGQLINQNGITASAISDGLIVNDMVSDHAAISGGKLDISSVITEINSDNSTTIKSSKIYLNDQAQSLEVAFNSLKTRVDTIQEVTIQGDLTAIVEQVQSNTSKIEANKNSINTLISEDTVIKKQVTNLQGTLNETETTLNSKYTALNQNLDGFKTTVADTYATKKSVTDVVDNIETNYSTTSVMNSAIKQKAQEISASVSSTYATKNEVSTLDNTLRQDYSTTQEMESAINVAKEAINLGVSTNYETKENVETKVASTLNSAKSYADTKKTEAINTAAKDATSKANTAKSEAITSANNTLTSTISNYYTKAQTDSQINVAKEAINLGVSTNYETKSNVQSKVTSTLNSAKSYADTKKTEAINTAASDATTKANNAKSEAIKSANNTLTSTISNYYTKAQTDSQINIAKEAINLGVSTTYETKENSTSKIQNAVNNIQVGGTNLWVLLDLKTGYEKNGNIAESTAPHKIRQTLISTNGSRQLVYQCWNPNKVANSSNTNRVAFFDSSKAYISSTGVLALNGQTYQWQIINIPENTAYVRLGAICGSADKYDTTIKIKFELGNKPTDYSLAPEDATNDISTAKQEAITSANNTLTSTIANYYTKTQTDSQINIAKEAINLGVSNTYETKANVTTKVTSTLNSAKSYADTKKTEAINTAASDATTKANNAKSEAISTAASDATTKANNAKSEAIKSANNTLTSTISNYYTKAQTDSQINIAKEAINLGVSTNYETKANVESKIKDISVGGTNLAFDTNKGITSWDWAMQTNGGRTITEYLADGVKGVKMTKDAKDASGWNYVSYGGIKRDKITPATTYVVSFEMKSNQTFNVGSVNLMNADSTNTLLKSSTAVQNKVTANSTAWSKIIFRLVTRDTLPSSKSQVIFISGIPVKANATHYFRNLKLEAGNTPTAWSPAPEDVTNDISTAKTEAITSANNTLTSTISNYYTKGQTDSQINVAKEAINLGVSTNYETKANVETKVTSTLNSAKSYADTKKTEAIKSAASDATTKANNAKSEAIKSANNTLTSTISNYYTKAQTDSQINIAKEAINLGVSNTYETKANVENKINNIQIGGTNLVLNSNFEYDRVWTKASAVTRVQEGVDGGYCFKTVGSLNKSVNFSQDIPVSKLEKGEKYTATIWIKTENIVRGTTNPHLYFFSSYFTDGTWKGEWALSKAIPNGTTPWTKYVLTFTMPTIEYNIMKVEGYARDFTGTIWWDKIKIEKGNKATEWSPAPDDIETNISNAKSEAINSANNTLTSTISNYYTKTQTDSQINIAKEAINLGVSTTYETKENVQTKVTSTLNSAKSYADTKKTEAINTAASDATTKANNAKSEAIKSANNTLSSTISNYYTKSQTDSQINVAKNAITSSVSSTYETKTDSTTKYNSLTTRMSTAESKITDTAITSTVKRNFYTKTETDGKVTTVQNNMNSSVTQLSNQIATKVDVNGVKSTIQQDPDSVKIGFNKISNALTVDSTGMLAKTQNGKKYFQLGYNGITMYNPENGTHEWGRLSAINSKFTLASNGNSSGLSIGHFVDNVYAEDMLCASSGKITIARELNHNGILYNNYGQVFIKQTGQGGWEITGRSDSQAIKPGGANQGAIGSNTQYVNQSWIANRYNPSSIEVKHVSHYVEDNECISLVNGVKPARYFYKEYDEEGNDITTFASRSSQLGLIYEDVRECSARDLITNEEDKGINLYGMVSTLWGATRNVNTRLNDAEYEIVLLKEEIEQLKNKLGEK